jgi:hypothetical protein
VFFFSKGSYSYDRPNSLLLIIEPVLFKDLNICGRYWGKAGEFGQNQLEKRSLEGGEKGAVSSILIGAEYNNGGGCLPSFHYVTSIINNEQEQ